VEDKKLSRGLVGDKNLTFCSVPWHPVCPVPGTIFKSNTVLKLSCIVLYFLEKKEGKFNFSNGTQMLHGPMVLELHTRFCCSNQFTHLHNFNLNYQFYIGKFRLKLMPTLDKYIQRMNTLNSHGIINLNH
jgi:hypothetical protein